MIDSRLRKSLADALGRSFALEPHPTGDVYVSTPFAFADGDVLPIYLRETGAGLVVTDHGKTIQHLSYEFQDIPPTVWAHIEEAAERAGLRLEGGVATVKTNGDVGLSVLQFAQGLTSMAALRAMRRSARETTRPFPELFAEHLARWLRDVAVERDFVDREVDSGGVFPVPYRVDAGLPIFVFPLATSEHCASAAATSLFYQRAGRDFLSIGVFRDQERVTGRARGQAMQVLDRVIPTLASAEEPFLRTVDRFAGTPRRRKAQ